MAEAAQRKQSDLPDFSARAWPLAAPLATSSDRLRKEASVRNLAPGERLFNEGEVKTHVYQVEAGAVCLYRRRASGAPLAIEMAFPHDFIGLGFLKAHIYSAQATMQSRVTCFPLHALEELIDSEPRLKSKQSDAVEEEFAARRNALTASKLPPAQRLAAFLAAVSRVNQSEGRDPGRIADFVTCGSVSDFLSFDIDTLRGALVELRARGLIEHCPPSDLRLIDLDGLERFSETPDFNAATTGGPVRLLPLPVGGAVLGQITSQLTLPLARGP